MLVKCSWCRADFRTEKAGRQFCPNCGAELDVPAPAAQQPPPAAADERPRSQPAQTHVFTPGPRAPGEGSQTQIFTPGPRAPGAQTQVFTPGPRVPSEGAQPQIFSEPGQREGAQTRPFTPAGQGAGTSTQIFSQPGQGDAAQTRPFTPAGPSESTRTQVFGAPPAAPQEPAAPRQTGASTQIFGAPSGGDRPQGAPAGNPMEQTTRFAPVRPGETASQWQQGPGTSQWPASPAQQPPGEAAPTARFEGAPGSQGPGTTQQQSQWPSAPAATPGQRTESSSQAWGGAASWPVSHQQGGGGYGGGGGGGDWPPTGPMAEGEPSPWESRGDSGAFASLVATWKAASLDPKNFFGRLAPTGIGPAFTYAWIMGAVGGLFAALWQLPLSFLGQDVDVAAGVAQLLAAPLLAAVGIWINAGLVHLGCLLFGCNNRGFEATFRAVAYSQGPALLGIVPFVGAMVGWIWSLVLSVIAVERLQRTTTGKAIGAALLPVLIGLVLCGCAFALIFATVGAGIMGGLANQQ